MIKQLEKLNKDYYSVRKKIIYKFKIPTTYKQLSMDIVEKVINKYYEYSYERRINSEDHIIVLNLGGFYEVELWESDIRWFETSEQLKKDNRTLTVDDIEHILYIDYCNIKKELGRLLEIKGDLDLLSIDMKENKFPLDKIWKKL